MAAVRFPIGGGRFRHYGSPSRKQTEQPTGPKVPSKIMKIVLLIVLALALILVTALLSTLFLYAGWNWGLVPATGLPAISLTTTFWLSLLFSTVAGCFRSSLSVNSKD